MILWTSLMVTSYDYGSPNSIKGWSIQFKMNGDQWFTNMKRTQVSWNDFSHTGCGKNSWVELFSLFLGEWMETWWYKHCPGRPSKVTTPEMIRKFHDMVLRSPKSKLREIDEAVGISSERFIRGLANIQGISKSKVGVIIHHNNKYNSKIISVIETIHQIIWFQKSDWIRIPLFFVYFLRRNVEHRNSPSPQTLFECGLSKRQRWNCESWMHRRN